jgi:hypothetical protein
MEPKAKNLAERQQAIDRVRLRSVLNARHLVTVEASGLGYLPNAPRASCLANCCADLFDGHP